MHSHLCCAIRPRRINSVSTPSSATTSSRSPTTPIPTDWEQASNYYNSTGLRDTQRERDSFAILNWVHTLSPKAQFEIAPFYHFNQASYDSPSTDFPVATTWHQSSNYVGAQADLNAEIGSNNFSAGLYSFFQHENDLFGLLVNDQSFSGSSVPNTSARQNAGLIEVHFSDELKLARYFSLYGGMRISSYHAGLSESAAYPRIGATLEIPAPALGIPRILWALFSACSGANRLTCAAELCEQSEWSERVRFASFGAR